MKLRYPRYVAQKGDEVPTYLKQLFLIPLKELKEFGFQPCCYLQVEQILKLYPPITWEILLYNKTCKTYAKVAIRRPVETVNLFDIEFYTYFKDGWLLETMNGKAYSIFAEIKNLIIQDAYTPVTLLQWQMHQNKLNELLVNKQSYGIPPQALAKVLEFSAKTYLDDLVKVKKVLPISGTGLFNFNWQAVLKITHQMVQGAKKAGTIFKERQQLAKTDPSIQVEIPIELEVEGFLRMKEMQQGLLSGKLRTWLLLVSFVFFVASYTKIFSFERLVIFIAVLVLHEGGHVLAMKLFGYQDASILFLPFLGAVATARKDNATLSEKFWISLAGPLPGLILGVGLAIACREVSDPTWVRETAWMLIGLNFFNLLPVYPLDGGQIANLLLFSRFPYTDVLFKLFGLVVIGLLAIGQPGMLLLLILVALSIPHSFRSAKINSKLREVLHKNPPTSHENLLFFIFKHLKEFGNKNLSFSLRYALVKDLSDRYYESRGRWTTRGFLVIIYFCTLFGAIAGSLQAITPRWVSAIPYMIESFEKPQKRYERFREKKKQEVEQASAALSVNPNDSNAYLKRARARTFLRDRQGALADYDRLVRLNPNHIQYRLARANFRQQSRDYKGAIEDYNHLLRLRPQDAKIYTMRANTHRLIKDYRSVIQDYNTLIELDPKQAWAYVERGYAYLEIKDYQGALADANSAIKLEPDMPESYELRSKVRHILGDKNAAIADEQKAKNLYQFIE